MRFELALRGLGRREPAVARLLAEVDAMTLGLFGRKFLRLAESPQTASELAALFYLAAVGSYQALSRAANPPQLKDQLKRLIATHLIRQQAPAKAPRRQGATAAQQGRQGLRAPATPVGVLGCACQLILALECLPHR